MKNNLAVVLILVSAGTMFGAKNNPPSLIPAPQKLELREGSFTPDAQTGISYDDPDTGAWLAEKLRPATGFPFATKSPGRNIIELTMTGADTNLGPEGYDLTVSSNGVVIRATASAGLFYGCQTLLQLLPPEIFSSNRVAKTDWPIPCLHIVDQPRFHWRGMLLDVSRHFFTKTEVEQVLDLMALEKLNTFHWHLVDDQGWRIEIKKYPKLTEVGAWRQDWNFIPPDTQTNAHPAWAVPAPDKFGPDGRYGGFYTQDDIREIVAYAAARHITVVPEIEMPGHSVAALSAYPQFSCFGGPYSTDVGMNIHLGVYCAGNDATFAFLQDVLTEVFQLFPGKYIHIGGDEVRKDNWDKCPKCQARIKAEGLKDANELQSYFIRRMEKFVNANGRTLIGWSEILQGGLAPNAAVMDWIGGGKEAASSGHDAVMSPEDHCYLDHYAALDTALEPQAIGGACIPLKKIYSFDPVPAGLSQEFVSHVLGGQANLWTEYVASLPHAQYMIFPRLCALAEVDWSPAASRNWTDFSRRLPAELRRLDALGVNYRPDNSVQIGEWTPALLTTNAAGTNLEWNVGPLMVGPAQYRVTFEFERGTHGLNISSVSLVENGHDVASDTHAGFAGHRPSKPVFVLNLPAQKGGAKCLLRAHVSGAESAGSVSWTVLKQ